MLHGVVDLLTRFQFELAQNDADGKSNRFDKIQRQVWACWRVFSSFENIHLKMDLVRHMSRSGGTLSKKWLATTLITSQFRHVCATTHS